MMVAARLEEGEAVGFASHYIAHPSGRNPVPVSAHLFLPSSRVDHPVPAMVLLTSSAGIQRHRELYYADALRNAGVGALVVDSFSSRGVRRTVADQTLVTAVQMEADAFGALSWLQRD